MNFTPLAVDTAFTFPSGETIALPAGFIVCTSPGTVTYDAGRSIPVGVTPSGRTVFSGYSCGAYGYAVAVLNLQRDIEAMRARAKWLADNGRALRSEMQAEAAEIREKAVRQICAGWATDPAPCICPDPAA